jgi:hypothetical protein
MKHILAVQVLSGLAACAAEFVLGLRWTSPSPSQWAEIDAMYAAAERRHDFLCVYAVNSWPEFIRDTRFNAWLHTPETLHAAVAVIIINAFAYLCAMWLARRTEARMREGEV